MKRIVMVLVGLSIQGCLLVGCNEWGIVRPKTRLTVDPWTKTVSFENTKDVDSDIKGFDLRYSSTQPACGGPTETTATVHMDAWVLHDNASKPMEVNVKQMEVAVKQMEQTNQMIQSTFAGLSGLATSLVGITREIGQSLTAMKALTEPGSNDFKTELANMVRDQVRIAMSRPAG